MTDHDYLSTACHHELHDRCRQVCKFCDEPCRCSCHTLGTAIAGLRSASGCDARAAGNSVELPLDEPPGQWPLAISSGGSSRQGRP